MWIFKEIVSLKNKYRNMVGGVGTQFGGLFLLTMKFI
jgi:hypothetical protein